MAHTMSYIVTCVPSGLDFKAAGGSIVRYCFCNCLLRGHQVAINMTWALFLWSNAETLKRAPIPLFDRLVRCSTHGLFHETTVLAKIMTVEEAGLK